MKAPNLPTTGAFKKRFKGEIGYRVEQTLLTTRRDEESNIRGCMRAVPSCRGTRDEESSIRGCMRAVASCRRTRGEESSIRGCMRAVPSCRSPRGDETLPCGALLAPGCRGTVARSGGPCPS